MPRNEQKLQPSNIYHRFLIKNFGGIYYEGCAQLAKVMEWYNFDTDLKTLYERYDKEYGSSPSAVERNVRSYVNHILKTYSVDTLSKMFDYKFMPGKGTTQIMLPELIAVMKYYVDNPEEFAQDTEELPV